MERLNKSLSIVLMVVWIALIFSFSSQEASESSAVSNTFLNGFINAIEFFEPDFSDRFDMSVFHGLIRGAAHFFLYFFLGVFSFNVFSIFFSDWFRLVVDATLFSMVVGIFDEIYQSFVPGRAMMIEDIFIDTVGALFGSVLMALVIFKGKSRTSQEN